jgi:glycosyltransferase involved in cell wall biosynthesis
MRILFPVESRLREAVVIQMRSHVEAHQDRPSFSVVIPAYNAERFLAAAIQSALAQSYPPAEVIVVDDGSTDNTLQIAQSFGASVHCISQKNSGASTARNAGIQAARHEWIALLDADDLWHPEKLARQAEQIMAEPEVDLLYTSCQCFFEDRVEKLALAPPASQIKQVLFDRVPFMPSSVVLSRAKILQIGGFNPAMRFVEDWEMWLRLVQAGARFAGLSEPLTYYRRSPQGLSHQVSPTLQYQTLVVRKFIATDAPAPIRWWKQARVISRMECEAAILARECGHADYFGWMRRSLLRFPFPLSPFSQRYRIALHMLLTSMGVLRRASRSQ